MRSSRRYRGLPGVGTGHDDFIGPCSLEDGVSSPTSTSLVALVRWGRDHLGAFH